MAVLPSRVAPALGLKNNRTIMRCKCAVEWETEGRMRLNLDRGLEGLET